MSNLIPLALSYGAGVLSGVMVCHRVSMWWRWGNRGRARGI